MSNGRGWLVEGLDSAGRHIDEWGPFDTEAEAKNHADSLVESGRVHHCSILEDFKDGRNADLE